MPRPLLYLALIALSTLPASAQPDPTTLEEQVKDLHRVAQGDRCRPIEEAYEPEEAYQAYEIEWVPDYEGAEPETVRLFQLFCDLGAYNVVYAYYWWREYEGLQPLYFAVPTVTAEYESPDNIDSPLLGVTLTGMSTTNVLINSRYDPKTETITALSLWRGLGDASSAGTWVFEGGEFVLKLYEVDASYDDEMNPETLVDYRSGTP